MYDYHQNVVYDYFSLTVSPPPPPVRLIMHPLLSALHVVESPGFLNDDIIDGDCDTDGDGDSAHHFEVKFYNFPFLTSSVSPLEA